MKFIYVFSEDDKRVLENMGYELIKTNGKAYVFLSRDQENFDSLPVRAVFSSTLTF